jgi:CheY-like chemotaxis protein
MRLKSSCRHARRRRAGSLGRQYVKSRGNFVANLKPWCQRCASGYCLNCSRDARLVNASDPAALDTQGIGMCANISARTVEIKSLGEAVSVQVSVVAPVTRPGAVKILHIEDDLSVARSMARVLRLSGFEVASAATLNDVLRHLEVDGFRPDLILTDFQLGLGSTGERLVAEVAARLHFKPPTIMMTGIPRQNVRDAGSFADRTLAKPVDIHVLLREIDALLGTHHSPSRP